MAKRSLISSRSLGSIGCFILGTTALMSASVCTGAELTWKGLRLQNMAKKQFKIVTDPEDAALFRVKDMETGQYLAPAVSNYGKAQEILEAVKFDERMNAEHGAGMHEEHSAAGCRLCNEPAAEEIDLPPDGDYDPSPELDAAH
jgi:hypothetical protein